MTTEVKITWLLKNQDSVLQIAEFIFLEFYTEFPEIEKKIILLTISVIFENLNVLVCKIERIDFMKRINKLLD